jgi:outer membrane protein TolC
MNKDDEWERQVRLELEEKKRRAEEAARKAFAAGELDRTDQEAAEAAYIDAQIAAIEAWKAAWTAVADLEDALRQPGAVETAALDAAIKRAGDAQ